jgi:hypothetical protein
MGLTVSFIAFTPHFLFGFVMRNVFDLNRSQPRDRELKAAAKLAAHADPLRGPRFLAKSPP